MSDEVETMAYVGETPWHGLGFKVERGLLVPDFLKKAGLDWEVKRVPIMVDNDPGDPLRFIDHYAMIRAFPDGRIDELGICGKQYTPTQNAEAFEFFNKYCDLAGLEMETAGSLRGGRQIFALAKIPDEDFEVVKGDPVSSYLLLSHPHIWGKSLQVKWTPIRVVCMNTLMQALKGGADFTMRHIYAFDSIMRAHAIEQVEAVRQQMIEFKATAKFLASVETTDQTLFGYIADLFQTNVANEEVITPDMFKRNAGRVLQLVSTSPGANLKSAKDTWWGAFNAVTYFYDHEYGNSDDGRLDNAWFGGNASKKVQALDLAVEYAKAA